MCSSACFFIFAAGTSRAADIGDAILGIHRPYLPDATLGKLSGDQAMLAAIQTRIIVEKYLKEMGVPSPYAEMMFLVPPGEIRWITSDEFQAGLEGIVPELRDWVSARGKAALEELQNMNADNMPAASKSFIDAYKKRLSDPITRDIEVLNELADDAWKQMFGQWNSRDRTGSFCRQQN
jgi:hypothetical protein